MQKKWLSYILTHINMRRCLIVLLISVFCITAHSGLVKVTMKNGTSITGTYKELDPISHITIVMANHDVVIPMSEILEIEELAKSSDSDDDKHRNENAFSLKYGQYSITDNDSQYPDSINVTIGGQKITMLLVRGGTFNMGYNGWHSRSYNSEPVHRVTLSSFYVSEN